MKILAIRGSNLASLAGDFEIDLSRAPFADTGLFAIVGNTGAGKSTLLDALCVALFDRTPRLTNHSRVTIGRGDDDPATLGAHDARTLLRRGATQGYAEVDFEAGDARRYRARWSVRRARNQSDGAIQDQQISLLALDGSERLGGTKTETLKAIASRLGLSFDQFRRSALLAQNDFAAFLRADGRDRSELLERMTGTEIYSRLSIEAHLRAALAEQRLRDTRAAALAIPILDDSARAAAESDLALAVSARTAARARFEAAELASRWVAEATARRAALATADAEHAAAVAAVAAAEPDRRELELRQRAEKLRGVFETAARLERELATATSQTIDLETRADHARSVLATIDERRSAMTSLLEPLRDGRVAAGLREPLSIGESTPAGAAALRPDGLEASRRAPEIKLPKIDAHVGANAVPMAGTANATTSAHESTLPTQLVRTNVRTFDAHVGANAVPPAGSANVEFDAHAPPTAGSANATTDAHVGASEVPTGSAKIDAHVGANNDVAANTHVGGADPTNAHVGANAVPTRSANATTGTANNDVGANAHVGAIALASAEADLIANARAALPDARWLTARAALANDIATWPELDERFAQHAATAGAIATLDRALADREAARAALATTHKLATADHQAAANVLAEAQRKASAFGQRKGPSLDAARKQEDDARSRLADAERLIAIAARARGATATCVSIDARLAELVEAETRDREAQREAEAAHERATLLRTERTRVADELRRAAGYSHARTELRDGEPCPLCGAEDHPWRDRGALDDVIAAAQASLDEALAQLASATGTLAAIAARAEQRATERDRLGEQRGAALASANDAATAWREQLATGGELILDGDPSTPGAEQLAAEREAAARKQLETSRSARAHAEAAAKAAADAQAEVQLAQANVDQQSARLADLTRSLADHDSTMQRLRGERAGRIERLGELAASLEATIDRWLAIERAALAASPSDDASLAGASLEDALRGSLDLVQRSQPLATETTDSRGALKRTLEAAQEATLEVALRRSLDRTARDAAVSNRVAVVDANGGHATAPPTTPSSTRTTAPSSSLRATPLPVRATPSTATEARAPFVSLVRVDRDDLPRSRDALVTFVAGWREYATRVTAAERSLLAALVAIDHEARDTERAVTELGARLVAARHRRDELVRERDEATAALTTARAAVGLEDLPLGLADEPPASVATDPLGAVLADNLARIEALAARLAALDAAVVRTRAVAGERAQLAAEHDATRPPDEAVTDAATLDAMAAASTEAEAHASRAAAAIAADADARTRREAALGAVADDEARVEIDRVLGGVIGSHDGKLFRSFAQSLTLDALLQVANSHLDELAPRYQLERIPRHDLEIQVIDRDLGAEVRSVQSLSGGESFLVSLALALGLSSMSAHDVRVRTLLIDEGFGTLDPTALDSALAVLDTLQATGRQIGVISHVPALVERVGAHVRVVQRGGGRSEVIVRA